MARSAATLPACGCRARTRATVGAPHAPYAGPDEPTGRAVAPAPARVVDCARLQFPVGVPTPGEEGHDIGESTGRAAGIGVLLW